MQRATPGKITAPKRRVKVPLTAEQVQARIDRLTGKAVAGMIKALSLYYGKPGERWLYAEFRRQKRKLYALYPDNPRKAKAIVNFALVRAGWSSKGPE